MSAFRPLPSRPNLEFEHKEAKALLRRLRDGDAEALARARERHPAIDTAALERIKLADAQLVIAREYGFASWPKLVRYFEDVERLGFNDPQLQDRAFYESSVRWLIQQHQARRGFAARHLAAYVPRFYGMRSDDVYASAITEDDARLAVARSGGSPSWDALLERSARNRAPLLDGGLELTPLQRAGKAMQAADLDALRAIVVEHAELLDTGYVSPRWTNLMRMALHRERTLGPDTMRPIMAWLTAQGFDRQRELNTMLTGRMSMEVNTVRWLLESGATPDWIAPNGIPVLEHALIRYWNGAAVDVLAARATPRRALWIAAGLGDVKGVAEFLDHTGKPRPEAYAQRPPHDAVGGPGASQHPEPDDEEILVEALWTAMTNGRANVVEYLASRGAPVNSLIYASPIINPAIGNGWVEVVEALVRGGADLDVRGWHPDTTPREAAREMLEMFPHEPGRRRIAIACGLDPDKVIAERDARPVPPPGTHPDLPAALELAGDDAARLGQSDIKAENVLFGMLRSGGAGQMFFTRVSRMDIERFVAELRHRLLPKEDRIAHAPLPLHPDAQALLRAAIDRVTSLRGDLVNSHHLLYEMTKSGEGFAADLLARYRGDMAVMNAELGKGL
jgi:hypothetical protein